MKYICALLCEWLLDMNGCKKWVATKNEWQVLSRILKYYLAGLRVNIYTHSLEIATSNVYTGLACHSEACYW